MPKATGPVYRIHFRRRRAALTNYAKRLAFVKSGRPRLVVRASNARVRVQLVRYAEKGDEVLASADSSELAKFSWSPRANLPSAYLTGALAAKRGMEKGAKEFVLDIGLAAASKGALAFAAAKGALDAGLQSAMGEGLVDEGRLSGKHIAAYAAALKGKPEYEKQFAAYAKAGVAPEKLPELFAAAKAAVMKGGA